MVMWNAGMPNARMPRKKLCCQKLPLFFVPMLCAYYYIYILNYSIAFIAFIVLFLNIRNQILYIIYFICTIMAIRHSSFVHSFNICFLPKRTFNSLFIFLGQYVSNFINIYILYGHIDINMITFKKLSSTRSSCCTQVHVHCFDSKG